MNNPAAPYLLLFLSGLLGAVCLYLWRQVLILEEACRIVADRDFHRGIAHARNHEMKPADEREKEAYIQGLRDSREALKDRLQAGAGRSGAEVSRQD